MKTKLYTLLILLSLWTGTAAYDGIDRSGKAVSTVHGEVKRPERAPDVAFTTRDGRFHSLESLPENGIVLHFWASWCAPCAIEFPALWKQVQASHGKLALVAVSVDDDPEAMDRFIGQLKRRGIAIQDPHLYWVWDKNKDISLKTFNTTDVPETILIDSAYTMVGKIVGDPGWGSSDNIGRLHTLARKE